LRWAEVDFERRVIDLPPARLKSGKKTQRGHVVPLPSMAAELLRAIPQTGPYVFPGRSRGQHPITFRALTQAARRLWQHPEDPFPHFTPRDLRRTIKTHLAAIGVLNTTLLD
jgi:integrase